MKILIDSLDGKEDIFDIQINRFVCAVLEETPAGYVAAVVQKIQPFTYEVFSFDKTLLNKATEVYPHMIPEFGIPRELMAISTWPKPTNVIYTRRV